MKRFVKTIAVMMLMVVVIYAVGCTKDPNNNNDNGGATVTVPVVETSSVSEITETSAIGRGTVTSNGGSPVTERGVCWAVVTNPTINDGHTASNSNMSTFSCQITNLVPNTTYYVRAYAINGEGVGYGNQISFITLSGNGGGPNSIPVVETSPVREITETSAIGGGVVTSDSGGNVVERGVCWSNQPNPIVSGDHTVAGIGLGTFSCEIFDLEPNTTYYVRAYAINSLGVGYGNEVNFTTMSSGGGTNVPEGAICGIFSVSAMDKVYFSKGNLQYQASTDTWRFAEPQFYTIGDNNSNISSTYDGWIDLFGWGTSGYNHGAVCYQPWSTSTTNSDYYAYGNPSYSLFSNTGEADWGYNPISNGGNAINQWRTLKSTEWVFLLTARYTSSGIRYAKAQLNGVNGIILVPDDWNVTTFSLNNVNESSASYTSNVVGEMVWQNTFEPAGAVFLPVAGYRYGIYAHDVRSGGYYWSALYRNGWVPYLYFTDDHLYPECLYDNSGNNTHCYGRSVRLVCPVE